MFLRLGYSQSILKPQPTLPNHVTQIGYYSIYLCLREIINNLYSRLFCIPKEIGEDKKILNRVKNKCEKYYNYKQI